IRLARVVDRASALDAQLQAGTASGDWIHESLAVLARRARYINMAIALCSISALLVSLVVVLLFSSAFLPLDLSITIAVLFVASMLSLTCAFLFFLIESRLATAALRFGGHR